MKLLLTVIFLMTCQIYSAPMPPDADSPLSDSLMTPSDSLQPLAAENSAGAVDEISQQAPSENPPAKAPAVEPAQVFHPEIETSASAAKEIIFPQDPRLSVFLSITFPGLGQLYQGNYWKAFCFTGTFLASTGVIQYYFEENSNRSAQEIVVRDSSGEWYQIRIKPEYAVGQSELTTSEKWVNAGAFVVAGVSYFWGIIDAYKSAKAYNRKHFFGPASGGKKVSLQPVIKKDGQELRLVCRF